ncbi:MAG TPA: DUF721 domain-containing protein [Pirellulales bacterium]|jgi:predicted nucleic acid-binding Zn ribbon protein|nr:DUF721 domain-containing protein [Pirellulales bacterium]
MPQPQRLAQTLSELIARRGYTRVQASADYCDAWRQAVGEALARQTRVGQVRRGVLEALVANSTLLQEITFQKHTIIKELKRLLPEERIVDVRLRIGRIE